LPSYAEFLRHEDEFPHSPERPGSGAGDGGGTAAAAVVTRAGDAGEQPAHGQRPRHPHRHLGAVDDDVECLDARRYHGLERVHGAVHVALPRIGEEAGSPDPATTLRATGFAPHRAPRSYPFRVPSRTITRPEGTGSSGMRREGSITGGNSTDRQARW